MAIARTVPFSGCSSMRTSTELGRGTGGDHLVLDLGRELPRDAASNVVDGALALGPDERQRVADRRDDLGASGTTHA